METSSFLSLLLVVLVQTCIAANSQQQQQQVQPQVSPSANQQSVHPHQQGLPNGPTGSDPGAPLDPLEPATTNHYPYQSSSLSPSNYHQGYPGTSNYGRDVYGGTRDNQGGWGWYPYFGVNAGTAWELSAYLGPVFWGIVAIVVTFGVCVGVSRFITGGDVFGGLFQRLKESTPAAARALDLNNVTNLVYQALETYGKYAKETRNGSTPSVKG